MLDTLFCFSDPEPMLEGPCTLMPCLNNSQTAVWDSQPNVEATPFTHPEEEVGLFDWVI